MYAVYLYLFDISIYVRNMIKLMQQMYAFVFVIAIVIHDGKISIS